MAVQFNLLPDVKLEFNRAQHAKRAVYGLSTLAIGIVVAIFVISFFIVNVLQKTLIDKTNDDITTYSKKLKSIPDLEKVLTIQNQLKSIPTLHQQKHAISRLFTYLPELTPAKISIGELELDADAHSLSVTGTADSIASINTFVDTLKFTKVVIGADKSTQKAAFTNVVLSQVGRSDKKASYTIDASFDPALFDISKAAILSVPNEVTTRSVINTPDINNLLFNGDTGKENNQNQQGGQ
jgi:Tfp pilus assembly protein PilN